jgi:hypothetical protein
MTVNQPDSRSVPSRAPQGKPETSNSGPYAVPVANYTQIPNVLIDVWMPLLQASEFAVLMCIARFTFGFHRNEVEMGVRLIAKRTGLHKDTVAPAVRALQERGLVACGGGQRNRGRYRIQVDAQLSDCLENTDTDCLKNPDTTVRKIQTRERNHHQKENPERKSSPELHGSGGELSPVSASVTPAFLDGLRIPPQPDSAARKPPRSSRTDDDEKSHSATARIPFADPAEELLARLKERGHEAGDPQHVLRCVQKQLSDRGLTLAAFLEYEVLRATGKSTNPAGMYTALVKRWVAEREEYRLAHQLEMQRAMKSGIRVDKPANDCPHCQNSPLGKGSIQGPSGAFLACVCASPALSALIASMESSRAGKAASAAA